MSAYGPQSTPGRGRKDASPSAKALTTLSLLSIVGLCLIAAVWVYRHSGRNEADESTTETGSRLQNGLEERTGIEEAWKEQDRRVNEHLAGYGWVDRAAGVVHIPIDRAMDLIVAEQKSSGPRSTQTRAIAVAQNVDTALQSAGRQLFRQYGCIICHASDAFVHAPSLVGIYGQRVRLSDGTFVIADDQYLRDSILHPGKQVVAGYEPLMPSYSNVIPEPDVLKLITFLKSFTGPESTGDPAASP